MERRTARKGAWKSVCRPGPITVTSVIARKFIDIQLVLDALIPADMNFARRIRCVVVWIVAGKGHLGYDIGKNLAFSSYSNVIVPLSLFMLCKIGYRFS